jgi:hypothetical protein
VNEKITIVRIVKKGGKNPNLGKKNAFEKRGQIC